MELQIDLLFTEKLGDPVEEIAWHNTSINILFK
jgi:hypothetical protein